MFSVSLTCLRVFNSRDRFITVSRSQAAWPPKLWRAVPLFPGTRIGTHVSRKRWHLDDCCFRKTSCESDPFKDDAAQRVSVCFSPGTFNVSCMLDSCWECCSWQHCNQQDLVAHVAYMLLVGVGSLYSYPTMATMTNVNATYSSTHNCPNICGLRAHILNVHMTTIEPHFCRFSSAMYFFWGVKRVKSLYLLRTDRIIPHSCNASRSACD